MNLLEHTTDEVDLRALTYLCQKIDAKVAIEVGSWVGLSATVLAERCQTVHCVDHFAGSPSDRIGGIAEKYGPDHVFRTFCENTRDKLFRQIFPHRGDSLLLASVWPFQVDLIFIDAEHTYEACRADTAAWWPHVRPGGIIAWHDYIAFQGVTAAVEEFGLDGSIGTVAWKMKPLVPRNPR